MNVVFNFKKEFFGIGGLDYSKLHGDIYYKATNGESELLPPADCKEFAFTYKDELIRMISCINDLKLKYNLLDSRSYIFLRLKQEGKLRVYNYYSRSAQYGVSSIEIFQINGGPIFELKDISLMKTIKARFGDCPAFLPHINDKSVKEWSNQEIVNFYNQNCN